MKGHVRIEGSYHEGSIASVQVTERVHQETSHINLSRYLSRP